MVNNRLRLLRFPISDCYCDTVPGEILDGRVEEVLLCDRALFWIHGESRFSVAFRGGALFKTGHRGMVKVVSKVKVEGI